jgi:ElaB/YqjD/DUF883 family membrane-anchored ribosome-binding protein
MKTKRIDPEAIDISYLKQEFNRFRDELSGAKEKLGSNAADALDQISAYLNGSGLSSRIAALEEDAVARLEKEVTHRPIASIAIAFGVGLLASQFFRRS